MDALPLASPVVLSTGDALRRPPLRQDTSMMLRRLSAITVAVALLGASTGAALADKIKNPIAVFSGLDKITGRIVSFEAAIDETVQFGALQLTPRVCYTRPATETPNTTAFVEVDETTASNEVNRIFTGWMFAASPGLHAVEHPIYDVWLKDCKAPAVASAPEVDTPEAAPAKAPARAKAPPRSPNATAAGRATAPAR